MTPSGPRPRAIVLTFDNLGEASAMQRGTWTGDIPLGQDPSVTTALPWLLDELDSCGLTATFFIEAVNCEINPQAVREIAARGHEVGVHGWSHEPWAALEAATELELLERSTRAFAELGITTSGFRPPGGAGTAQTTALLRRLGYRWYSPAGDSPTVSDGLASIPFDWELVDAYHLMASFGELRRQRGDRADPLSPDVVIGRMGDAIARHAQGTQTVILHPFLMLDGRWAAGARQLLAQIGELTRDACAWTVPGRRYAAWLSRDGA